MGVLVVLVFLISLGEVSTGFWLWVIPAVIIGVILYFAIPNEQEIFSYIAVVGSAALAWFLGGALSSLLGLFTASEKVGEKVCKWLDE